MACIAGGGGRARPQLQSVGGGGISGWSPVARCLTMLLDMHVVMPSIDDDDVHSSRSPVAGWLTMPLDRP
jgi:hypothetical protein